MAKRWPCYWGYRMTRSWSGSSWHIRGNCGLSLTPPTGASIKGPGLVMRSSGSAWNRPIAPAKEKTARRNAKQNAGTDRHNPAMVPNVTGSFSLERLKKQTTDDTDDTDKTNRVVPPTHKTT